MYPGKAADDKIQLKTTAVSEVRRGSDLRVTNGMSLRGRMACAALGLTAVDRAGMEPYEIQAARRS
jgi:hypothetical protein